MFVEGQTELVFVRTLLLRTADLSRLSFECLELLSHKDSTVPYHYASPIADVHFLILCVRGDDTVVSAISERGDRLFGNGYERIIGLRDLYSDEYSKLSHGVLDHSISEVVMKRHFETVRRLAHSDAISLHFAVMETEAWILGMHALFPKLDSVLTAEHVEHTLGVDLRAIDPEEQFYKPSEQVRLIMESCGHQYKKRLAEIETLCSKMTQQDFADAKERDRCQSFRRFSQEMADCQ